MTQKGRRFENEYCTELGQWANENDKNVSVWPCGYSGSNRYPCPDVAIAHEGGVYGLEFKNWNPSKLKSGKYELRYVDIEDCTQILDCANKVVDVGLGLKFSRREMVLAIVSGMYNDTIRNEYESDAHVLAEAIDDAFDPHVSKGGDLAVRKPQTDTWPTASNGRTAVEVTIDQLLTNSAWI